MSLNLPKPFVFVLMPFEKEFDDVYQLGIKEACKEAGAYCERVDEQLFHDSILDRIYNQISKADVIIADMTGRNPNVFYEAGYAHALGKKVILVTQNSEDIPFDLKHYPHIIYRGRITDLKAELVKRVSWCIQNPEAAPSELEFPLQLYVNGTRLKEDEETTCLFNDYEGLMLDLHNTSAKTYKKGEITIGAIRTGVKGYFDKAGITLPDGKTLHLLPSEPKMFPDGWYKVKISSFPGDNLSLIVRVFIPSGAHDFPILVNREDDDEESV